MALTLYNWDLIILHPPCTAIAVSGNAHYEKTWLNTEKELQLLNGLKIYGIKPFQSVACCIRKSCWGLNTMGNFPKPQYIQPWQFGHGETKKRGYGYMAYQNFSQQILLKVENKKFGRWDLVMIEPNLEVKLILELHVQYQINGIIW